MRLLALLDKLRKSNIDWCQMDSRILIQVAWIGQIAQQITWHNGNPP